MGIARYPVEVQLSDCYGNYIVAVTKVRMALRRAGASYEERTEFAEKALDAVDFDDLLETAREWVEVV